MERGGSTARRASKGMRHSPVKHRGDPEQTAEVSSAVEPAVPGDTCPRGRRRVHSTTRMQCSQAMPAVVAGSASLWGSSVQLCKRQRS